MPISVTIKKGEPVEKALRRFKKKLERESILKDVRTKRYFEKPSDVQRKKRVTAAFNTMLRQRHANK